MRSLAKVANGAGIMTKSSYLTLKNPPEVPRAWACTGDQDHQWHGYGRGSTHAWPPKDLVRVWRPLDGRWEDKSLRLGAK